MASTIQSIYDARCGQTTLDDYCPGFSSNSTSYRRKPATSISGEKKTENNEWKLDLTVTVDNRVRLQEERCPVCGKGLIKNGTNERVLYNLQAGEKEIYRLQRYHCKECGELHLDYSLLFGEKGKYDAELKREVRLAFIIGTHPARLQQLVICFLGIYIPLSTIKTWLYSMKEPLNNAVFPAKMPCSGSICYDEIHLKLERQPRYLQVSVDNRFRLILRIDCIERLKKPRFKGISMRYE